MQQNRYPVCLSGLLFVVKKLMGRVTAPSISRARHRAMASAASLRAHARQRLMCIRHSAPRVRATFFNLVGFRLVEKYGKLVCGMDLHWFDL